MEVMDNPVAQFFNVQHAAVMMIRRAQWFLISLPILRATRVVAVRGRSSEEVQLPSHMSMLHL